MMDKYTINRYKLPIPKNQVQRVDRTSSPAHLGKLRNAIDFIADEETPVLAAADGVVVKVINDASQNWDAWFPRAGETEEQFSERSSKYHLEEMKKDPYRAVTGNLVVIKHQGDEYSAYAHLKQGSVRVKPGDNVKQGQQIAEVGDTGAGRLGLGNSRCGCANCRLRDARR